MGGNKKSTLVRSPFPPFLSFVLDNPLRRLLINRDKFLREAGIREGDYVLEVGCGPGFFTEALSGAVGEKGRVYAQDVEKKMIGIILEDKIERLKLKNVTTLLCNSSETGLQENSLSVIFCANVLEEICKEGELEGTIAELDRVLRKGGIFFIKEHRGGGGGPAVTEAKKMLQGIGYRKVLDKKTLFSYHVKFVK